MATEDDVRRICSGLPGAVEGQGEQFGFGVIVKGKAKGFVWSWLERVEPKKRRMVNRSVLAVRVPNLLAKDMILQSDPKAFFTEDHYNGFPAVLVRLDAISSEELEPLVIEAWKCVAPKPLVQQLDEY
jgi:hypothetical protein